MSVERDQSLPVPARLPIWWILASAVALAAHLCIAFGPLRLNTDTARYLEAAASLAEGRAYTSEDNQFLVFPPGYSLLVSKLDRCEIVGAPVIAITNILFYAIGAWLLTGLVTHSLPERWRGFALALASGVALRHTGLAVSEPLFIAILGVSLAFAARAALVRSDLMRVLLLASALLIAASSILVRTIGVSVVGGILWWVAEHQWGRDRVRRLGLPIALAGIIVLAGTLTLTPYGDALAQLDHSPRFLWELAVGKGLNLLSSLANVPSVWHDGFPAMFMACAGFGALVLGALAVPRDEDSPVPAFLAGYGVLILLWPFEDPRFWLPVVPLAVPCVAAYLTERVPKIARCYLIVFLVGGVAVSVFQIRVAMLGSNLPEGYYASRAPHFERDYRLAWSDAPDADITRYARIIRRFEKRSSRYASERGLTATEAGGRSRNPG